MTGGSPILARGLGWDDIMIASSPSRPEAEGRRLDDIARDWHIDPLDAAMDILVDERGKGYVILFQLDEADLRCALVHPEVMIGSDGSSLAVDGELGQGKPHPRSYGTFPRVLARYVREEPRPVARSGGAQDDGAARAPARPRRSRRARRGREGRRRRLRSPPASRISRPTRTRTATPPASPTSSSTAAWSSTAASTPARCPAGC